MRLVSHGERFAAVANDVENVSDCEWKIRTKNASAMVASPNAFMMNAFFAAATAVGRSCQKPISR